MLDTFLKTLPPALAAAINPLGIVIIFFLMSKPDRPLQRAWTFLAGATSVLIMLTFIAHPLLKYTVEASVHKNTISAIIEIVIGLALIGLTFRKKKSRLTDRQSSSSMWRIFVAGIAFMALLDLETTLFYLVVIKTIYDADLSPINNFWLIVANIIIIMSTMALPVLLATIFPHVSKRFLVKLHQFITKYGDLLGKIVVITIALYLIYNGIYNLI